MTVKNKKHINIIKLKNIVYIILSYIQLLLQLQAMENFPPRSEPINIPRPRQESLWFDDIIPEMSRGEDCNEDHSSEEEDAISETPQELMDFIWFGVISDCDMLQGRNEK